MTIHLIRQTNENIYYKNKKKRIRLESILQDEMSCALQILFYWESCEKTSIFERKSA